MEQYYWRLEELLLSKDIAQTYMIMEIKMPFQESFHGNCIENAMPSHVQFDCMIEYCADIQSQLKYDASKTYLCHILNFVFTCTSTQ